MTFSINRYNSFIKIKYPMVNTITFNNAGILNLISVFKIIVLNLSPNILIKLDILCLYSHILNIIVLPEFMNL